MHKMSQSINRKLTCVEEPKNSSLPIAPKFRLAESLIVPDIHNGSGPQGAGILLPGINEHCNPSTNQGSEAGAVNAVKSAVCARVTSNPRTDGLTEVRNSVGSCSVIRPREKRAGTGGKSKSSDCCGSGCQTTPQRQVKPQTPGKSGRVMVKGENIGLKLEKYVNRKNVQVDRKREARGFAAARAASRSCGINPVLQSVEDAENFQPHDPAGGKEKEKDRIDHFLRPLENKVLPCESPKINFQDYRPYKYVSGGYVGDDFKLCKKLAVHGSFGEGEKRYKKGSWYYVNSIIDMKDERLNDKLVTRSGCNKALKGTFHWRNCSLDWPKPVWFDFFMLMLSLLSWSLDKYFKVYFEVPLLLYVTCGIGCFSYFMFWYLSVAVKTDHLDSRYDVYINLAHLQYGLRQNVDYSKNLISSKLRDKDLFIGDMTCLFSSNDILYRYLEKLFRCNVLTRVIEKRCTSEVAENSFKCLPIERTSVMFDKVKDIPISTRCFQIDGFDLGDDDGICVPEISQETLLRAYSKRINPKCKPALSDAQYNRMVFMINNALGESNIPDCDFGSECVAYAADFCARKMLNRRETEHVMTVAHELSVMSSESLLTELSRALNKTEWFVKDEVYSTEKPPSLRFIINPSIVTKLIFGTVLRKFEDYVYNHPYFRDHLIKHKTPEEILSVLQDRFGDVNHYVETDYSGFESSIRKEEIHVEFYVYKQYLTHPFHHAVLDIVENYMKKEGKILTNRELGNLIVDDIRLSGFPNTALGNALLNYANIMIAAGPLGGTIDDFIVEGDDALVKFRTKEHCDSWITNMKNQRFVVSDIETFSTFSEASFCGMRLTNGSLVPTKLQMDKFNAIFSRQCPSDVKALSLGVSRLCCYYAKYPSMQKTFVKLAKQVLKTFSGVTIHGSDVARLILRDYRVSDVSSMRDGAFNLLNRIITGNL